MQVIEKGRPQKGWALEAKCTGSGNGGGGCGAKLLVEKGDVYQTTSSSMGETDYYYTFTCPECHVETDIKSSEIPTNDIPMKADWLKRKNALTRFSKQEIVTETVAKILKIASSSNLEENKEAQIKNILLEFIKPGS